MAVSFNSNINALRSQRALSRVTEELGRHFSRLSTGMRINRASDDAAGLAIADTLRVNSRLYQAAARNVSDGISALNIVDGALSEQRGIIIRLQELAEQSANGTYSNDQRKALDLEYQALLKEFGRIGETTSFNGQKVLSGETGQFTLQVGINGESLSLLTINTANTANNSGTINFDDLNGVTQIVSEMPDAVATTESLYALFNQFMMSTTIIDENGQERELLIGFGALGDIGVRMYVFQKVADTGGVGAAAASAMTVQDENHQWILALSPVYFPIDENAGDGSLQWNPDTTYTLSFDNGSVSADFSPALGNLIFSQNSVNSGNSSTSAINCTGVDTLDRALTALGTLNNRLIELSEISGRIGSSQSRLESIMNVIGSSRENTVAAEARIRDADIASETAGLVSSQILQQTASLVLSQANLQPALLLELLDI